MIGTRCLLHTEMACKVATHNIPLFLEKPVAITFDQTRELDAAFRGVTAPVAVSFPLRVSPVLQRVKEIVDAGQIGTVEQVVAFNDVPYGSVYFRSWHRNYEENGGLFLQKATHDIDYINYLIGHRPKWISAMNARRVFGGEMPFDLRCADCDRQESCPESPAHRFRHGFEGEEVAYDVRHGACVFSGGIEMEDMGSCQIEYEHGAQVSYTPGTRPPVVGLGCTAIRAPWSSTGIRTRLRFTAIPHRPWIPSTSPATCRISAATASWPMIFRWPCGTVPRRGRRSRRVS
jgi:predicted dehydrogenase